MEEKNLSIAELERRAGLSIHSVRNILKGRIKKPSAQSLQAIAEALECSIIDLMNDGAHSSVMLPHELERKYKKSPLLECPDLMVDCASTVLKLVTEASHKITVDEFLDIVRKVYFYSSKEEPRTLDMRFTEWLIESQLGHQKIQSSQ